MNKKGKLKIYYVILAIFFIFPLTVFAETPNDNQGICVGMSNSNAFGYYRITDAGKEVMLAKITTSDINGVEGKYPKQCYCSGNPDLCSTTDENGNLICNSGYNFIASYQGKKCKVTGSDSSGGYSFSTCPANQVDVKNAKEISNTYSIKYNTSKGKYEISFNSIEGYENKIKIKFANPDWVNGKKIFPKYVNDEISLRGESYSLNNPIYLGGGEQFYLVFYLNDPGDPCNETILGTFQGSTPTTVKNPMYGSPTCNNFLAKYGTEGINGIYRNMVPECEKEWISLDELGTIENTINTNINKVNDLISNQNQNSQVAATNNFTCKFKIDSLVKNNVAENFSVKTGILTVAGAGTYWTAQCTESISIEYDDPKAVEAGMGFAYNATVKVNRTCTPIKIKEPEQLPNCTYGVQCYGPDHNGDAAAGPNEDFDTCINNCDGGKYSQSCINSCYNSVYENNSYLSANYTKNNVNFLTAGNKKYQVRRLASSSAYAGGLPRTGKEISNNRDSGCYVAPGTTIDQGHLRCVLDGVDFAFEDSCNGNTTCYGVYTNYPCSGSGGGSDEYENKVKASIEEYKLVMAAIREFNSETINNEKYEMVIEEEYNKQSNGSYLKDTTIFDNKGSNYTIKSVDKTSDPKRSNISTTKVTSDLSGLSEETKKSVEVDTSSITLERTITVSVGDSFIDRVTGDVLYNSKNKSSLGNNLQYESGNNKYFTKINTRVVNNYVYWPYYDKTNTSDSTDIYTKNIHVRFYNIGTWNQWGTEGTGINVDCLYGTDSGLVCTDSCCEPPCPTPCPDGVCPTPTPCPDGVCPTPTPCPDGECPEKTPPTTTTPTPTPGTGFRYIFRPITLTDMFPNNRNPRFNWTGTITSDGKATNAALTKDKSGYSYAVDPEKLISSIQSKGYSIYTDSSEVDYEFTLTKENIRNIRKYNKSVKDYNNDGSKNYLDYNMSCYTNAKQQVVCTSKFLDNVNGNSGDEESASNQYITYDTNGKGMDERKAIAGCNNSKNNECSDN